MDGAIGNKVIIVRRESKKLVKLVELKLARKEVVRVVYSCLNLNRPQGILDIV